MATYTWINGLAVYVFRRGLVGVEEHTRRGAGKARCGACGGKILGGVMSSWGYE